MNDTARELVLFADNDSMTYFRSILPTFDNLHKKMCGRFYDRNKAIKAIMYVMQYAAKRYHDVNCSNDTTWYRIFPKCDRLQAAEMFLDEHEDDIRKGDY